MSEKEIFKPGNMLYPLPAVMVSCADKSGKDNILTVAWTGTVCSDPPMLYISVRPGRFSHHMIEETGEFVVNLTTEKLARATDFCGVRSGRDVDKWEETRLTRKAAVSLQYAPAIAECPVNIECRVVKKETPGSHHIFLAEVKAVHVDDAYMDQKGRFALEKTDPIVYVHGQYYSLGKLLGTFGYSVKKPAKKTVKKNVKKKKK